MKQIAFFLLVFLALQGKAQEDIVLLDRSMEPTIEFVHHWSHVDTVIVLDHSGYDTALMVFHGGIVANQGDSTLDGTHFFSNQKFYDLEWNEIYPWAFTIQKHGQFKMEELDTIFPPGRPLYFSEGIVKDADTGEPVERCIVWTDRGFSHMTNEAGHYRFAIHARHNPAHQVKLHFYKEGYKPHVGFKLPDGVALQVKLERIQEP